jgi:hypothetical protein
MICLVALSLLPRTLGNRCKVVEKVALTDLARDMLSSQVLVPAQKPPQPVNVELPSSVGLMAQLDDMAPGARVRGVLRGAVTVVQVEWHGTQALPVAAYGGKSDPGGARFGRVGSSCCELLSRT